MRVAFQGVHGAYSEIAALHLFGARIAALPCETFEEVFRSVTRGLADRGVIPIENSLAGSIHQNYDLLLHHRVHIVAETHRRIDHVLVAPPGVRMEALRAVRSHPQALAQCSRFLRSHRRLKPEPFFDTAGAARSVAQSGPGDTGAIASPLAARMYGLRVLASGIANERNNFTRFLAISRKPWRVRRGVPTKCSIVFRPARNEVGVLFRILGVFSLRGIDLVKIESRPDPASPFEYMFYADFTGSPLDPHVARALEHLDEMVVGQRLLGAYPADRSISHRTGPP